MMKLLTVEEAGKILKIHPATVWRKIRSGKLKTVAVGQRKYIAEGELMTYLDSLYPAVRHTLRRRRA